MENTLVNKPESRPEVVDHMLNTLEKYDAGNIQKFEEYVEQQCSKNVSDIAANLALLKLYQFNTNRINDEVIINVLSLALINFNSFDFSLALHLLPTYVLNESPIDPLSEQIQKLFKLYNHLDGKDFAGFWTEFYKDDNATEIVSDIENFLSLIRASISKTIECACKSLSYSVLSSWVHLDENSSALNDWIKRQSWTLNGTTVEIPVNEFNSAKPIITTETVKFEQLSRLLKKAFEME
ncbi:ARM repeat-containing protein [Nadsonia fulvescens var. elongata DSM 6958]|uniref:Eukaryotic translation initiation factor 3 subunit K n=1 Tax=Nadsonia fulvescens var. elongata DSM 6958 TaxID=857566 RepID=A0A1E3PPC2_9ASCO|nr:ARM repeat-containing protein [Nadsonia fulvescens var. elongata DSM 6958]